MLARHRMRPTISLALVLVGLLAVARVEADIALAVVPVPAEAPSVEPDLAAAEFFETEPDAFEVPETIRGNIGFWIRVFSEWNLGQVAFHDMEYPALVYEVVDLPAPIEERYSETQRGLLDERRELWSAFLTRLEHGVASGISLEPIEQQWLDYIDATAGRASLAGAGERVRSQRGIRERFRAGLERSVRWVDRMRTIFREAGLPEDLCYLPHVESSFTPNARSSADAVGLWQFTRGAGRRYLKLDAAIDERLDPLAATHGATRYLADALRRLGSWPLAVTSYNHGVEGMSRARQAFGNDFDRIYREYGGRAFGFASKNFYAEFLAARTIAREPTRYFPEGLTSAPLWANDELELPHRTTPGQIARTYGVPVGELAALNPAWSSRAVRHGLTLPQGTRVWLPAGTLAAAADETGAVPLPAKVDSRYHVVRRGDTLGDIARRYGIDVGTLRRLNGMSPRSSLIHVGQRLKIGAAEVAARAGGPEPAAQTHVVRRGDTLARIAARYRVNLSELLALNNLSLKSIIHPGQSLRIPGLQ